VDQANKPVQAGLSHALSGILNHDAGLRKGVTGKGDIRKLGLLRMEQVSGY